MLSLTSNGNYKTTTWSERNKDQIKTVATLNTAFSPLVINVGPGGILPVAADLHIYGSQSDNVVQSTAQILGKMLESGLRKTGVFSLESFETEEIVTIFKRHNITPSSIAVIDIEPKVLDAVRKKLGGVATYIHADITKDSFLITGDIVFCNNVLQRVKEFHKASRQIVDMCKPGGIIAADSGKYNMQILNTLQGFGCKVIDKDKGIYQKSI